MLARIGLVYGREAAVAHKASPPPGYRGGEFRFDETSATAFLVNPTRALTSSSSLGNQQVIQTTMSRSKGRATLLVARPHDPVFSGVLGTSV